ncbi:MULTISPECIES: hypothetical protein [Mesorhizobium]|uniref:hypothetical protein n=1 Tax=Mesorhizobium TaxID=68287 RepID=UPI001459FD48|nr:MULTISPECIES: hypothetical protein [Mesorhizobium]
MFLTVDRTTKIDLTDIRCIYQRRGLFHRQEEENDRQAGDHLHRECLREAASVLTTKDKAKALAMAKQIGDKVRVEEITPKPK